MASESWWEAKMHEQLPLGVCIDCLVSDAADSGDPHSEAVAPAITITDGYAVCLDHAIKRGNRPTPAQRVGPAYLRNRRSD